MTDTQHQIDTRNYYANARLDMLDYVPIRAHTILEIGCGNGQFSREIAKRNNAETWGVEPNVGAARLAHDHMHKILTGTIESQLNNLPDFYFDCICMNDVVEHLINPWQILAALRRKLKPEGVLVASIPNVRHYQNLENLLIRGEWQYADAGILDRTHLRFFTHRSVTRLFNEAGYKVQEVRGVRRSRRLKLKILNFLTFGKLWDIAYLHFAIVAKANH